MLWGRGNRLVLTHLIRAAARVGSLGLLRVEVGAAFVAVERYRLSLGAGQRGRRSTSPARAASRPTPAKKGRTPQEKPLTDVSSLPNLIDSPWERFHEHPSGVVPVSESCPQRSTPATSWTSITSRRPLSRPAIWSSRESWQRTLALAGLDEGPFEEDDFHPRRWGAAMERPLHQGRPVAALVSASAQMAYGAMGVLKERGIAIPRTLPLPR